MKTQGQITLESYVSGYRNQADINPGHRSEFLGVVDLVRYKRIVFNTPVGTTTHIRRTDTSKWKLDRIWYSFTPGIRYEASKIIVSGSIHHDCIHVINQNEISGSTWWNAYQFSLGTKESFALYVTDYYNLSRNNLREQIDGHLVVAKFKKANKSLGTGQNHTYEYYTKIRLRYSVFNTPKWFAFINTDHHWWVNLDQSTEYKGQISLHLILKGQVNSLGIFYIYTPRDTFIKDNENNVSSIGLRILF